MGQHLRLVRVCSRCGSAAPSLDEVSAGLGTNGWFVNQKGEVLHLCPDSKVGAIAILEEEIKPDEPLAAPSLSVDEYLQALRERLS